MNGQPHYSPATWLMLAPALLLTAPAIYRWRRRHPRRRRTPATTPAFIRPPIWFAGHFCDRSGAVDSLTKAYLPLLSLAGRLHWKTRIPANVWPLATRKWCLHY